METHQSQVLWYLHSFSIPFSSIIMFTVFPKNISLHTVLHNFPIDIRELCESHGCTFTSFSLAGNYGNASVHDVFDGILLLHVDEKKCVT